MTRPKLDFLPTSLVKKKTTQRNLYNNFFRALYLIQCTLKIFTSSTITSDSFLRTSTVWTAHVEWDRGFASHLLTPQTLDDGFYFGHFLFYCVHREVGLQLLIQWRGAHSLEHTSSAHHNEGEKSSRAGRSICFRYCACHQVVNKVGLLQLPFKWGLARFQDLLSGLFKSFKAPSPCTCPTWWTDEKSNPTGFISVFWYFNNKLLLKIFFEKSVLY